MNGAGSQVSGVGLQASAAEERSVTSASEGARLRASLSAAVEEIHRLMKAARAGLTHQEDGLSLRTETPLVLMGAGAGSLGMSFEVTRVNVLNPKARIWRLIEVTFTGAAILRKDKAAFQDTWIELD